MKIEKHKCPNKNCKDYKKGMQNLSPYNNGYTNFICLSCNTHYAGKEGEERWFNNEEWEDYVNVVDGVDWRKKWSVCLA